MSLFRLLPGALVLALLGWMHSSALAVQISPPEHAADSVSISSKQQISIRPTLALQIGHDVSADKVAVSPDGKWLATGDGLGMVKLWNIGSGDLWWTLPEAHYSTGSLLFSPDSRYLVVGRSTDGIKKFEVSTGRLVRTLYPRKEAEKSLAFPVAFSPNGKLVWLARYIGLVQARSMGTGAIVKQWNIPGRFLAMASNAQFAASIDSDGSLHLWDMATGKRQRTLFKRPFVYEHPAITAAAFTADGTHLATGSYDGQVQLWNVATGKRLPITKLNLHILSREMFGDLPKDTTSLSHQSVTSMAFSKDGRTLVVGVGDHPELEYQPVSYVSVTSTTNPTTGKVEVESTPIQPRGDSVDAVAITPDGKTLISADDEATIRLWDAPTRRITRTLARSAEEAMEIAFTPDGKSLITSGQGQPVRQWDLETGSMAQPLVGEALRGTLYFTTASSFAVSPDGIYLAIGGLNGRIELWSGQPRRLVATLNGSGQEITSLAFSPDSRILASGSDDGLVRLWLSQPPGSGKYPYSLQKTMRLTVEDLTQSKPSAS